MTGPRALLVRHGQSTWNADGRWQGQADPPLSARGVDQSRAAVGAVAQLAPAIVITSDLVRARRTAELLVPPGVVLRDDARWRERHAGEWTGLTRDEIDERFPGWLSEWRSPPGFEDDESLLARVLPALDAILHDADAVVLVVTHGGVIRTLERHFDAPSVPVPNLGGRWFDAEDGVLRLGDREVLVDPDSVTVPDQI